MTKRRIQTKEEITNLFDDYYRSGNSIKAGAFSRKNPALYRSILRQFGSYHDFLSILGYENIGNRKRQSKWDLQKLKTEILKYYEAGNSITLKNIRNNRPELYYAIYYYCMDYEELIKSLNINLTEINERKRWDKETVVKEFMNRVEKGLDISPSCLLSDYSSLIGNMVKYYGSYKKAVEAMGFNYHDCIKASDYAQKSGFVFESLVKTMFDKLGKKYIYHYSGFNNFVVDFFDISRNEIIDAKLSSWSGFYSGTIKKYIPLCNKLTIVYLRGDHVNHNYEKLELRQIDEYYPILHKQNLGWIVDEFEKLKESVKFEEMLVIQEQSTGLTHEEVNEIKKALEKMITNSEQHAALSAFYKEMTLLKNENIKLKKQLKLLNK